jgi:hypothetical protein
LALSSSSFYEEYLQLQKANRAEVNNIKKAQERREGTSE